MCEIWESASLRETGFLRINNVICVCSKYFRIARAPGPFVFVYRKTRTRDFYRSNGAQTIHGVWVGGNSIRLRFFFFLIFYSIAPTILYVPTVSTFDWTCSFWITVNNDHRGCLWVFFVGFTWGFDHTFINLTYRYVTVLLSTLDYHGRSGFVSSGDIFAVSPAVCVCSV